jgi:hypothetical protein
MRFALVLALCVPSIASADGAVSFEVADHGDSVEIIAHNVEAKTTNVSSVRSRIEVPIVGAPIAARVASSDATVLFAEFDGHALSIKTRLGYPETKALAPFAKAQQVGSDLHLTFPRHVVVEAIAPAPVAAKPVVVEAPAAPVVVVVEKKPDIKQAQAALAAATSNRNPPPTRRFRPITRARSARPASTVSARSSRCSRAVTS